MVRTRSHYTKGLCLINAAALLLSSASAQAGEQSVELRSQGGYESMRLPADTNEVELEQQLAGACRFDRSWGYDLTNKELWVNGGCAARFKIITAGDAASSSKGSNTGAAIAAAAAIAGLAILAHQASKDREPDRPDGGGGHRGEPIRGQGNLCLDIDGGLRPGRGLIVYHCTGRENQRFRISHRGELQVGQLCLDIERGNRDDGARVIAWDCNRGAANQRWTLRGNQIRSELNGKCLDLKEGHARPGQPVIMWRCNGGSNQRWWW